jgi:hypothetical protein
MTDSTPAPADAPTQPEAPEDRRSRLLFRLFDALLIALVKAVESTNAKASLLDVARKLLRDNDIRADGLRDGLAKLADRRSLKLPFDA